VTALLPTMAMRAARGRVQALVLALLVALAAPATAELTATIEPRVVDEFDTARLTIRATGTNQTTALDLDALEADFEVLTTQSSSQYRSINGRVESWVEYQILLRPKRSGDLTVPPVGVGGEFTEPLTLRVRGMPAEMRQAIERMVFFETELTRNPVYVQSQTVLIRRLYYSSGAQIYSDLPGMPEIPGAIVTPLGETTSTATIRDGQRYGVIEQRFAILPERSGTLTIPAISVTSSVRLRADGRTRRTGVRVATEPFTVEVLPIPADYPADHPWLPAESVTLSETWTPDRRRMEVGEPLRRSLRAEVVGNVASAIPPLTPALPDDHFRRYPEPPEIADDERGNSIRGVREQAYSIIPTAPGTVPLGATELVWWDVDARAVRTARVPGRTMTITGAPARAPADAAGPADAPASAATDSPADAAAADGEPDAVAAIEDLVPGRTRRETLYTLGAAVLVIAVLAYLLRGVLAGPGAGHAGSTSGAPPSRRTARERLARACKRGTTAEVHAALLDYLRSRYAAPLPEAQRRFRADGHADVLDGLNAARYRDGGERIDGAAVWQAVRSLDRQQLRARRRNATPLPPLYD
jgi:hypothetical protein